MKTKILGLVILWLDIIFFITTIFGPIHNILQYWFHMWWMVVKTNYQLSISHIYWSEIPETYYFVFYCMFTIALIVLSMVLIFKDKKKNKIFF